MNTERIKELLNDSRTFHFKNLQSCSFLAERSLSLLGYDFACCARHFGSEKPSDLELFFAAGILSCCEDIGLDDFFNCALIEVGESCNDDMAIVEAINDSLSEYYKLYHVGSDLTRMSYGSDLLFFFGEDSNGFFVFLAEKDV